MSQDEIRKLLGGYATGTLTEAERQTLFAAALDDQDLFDELGREQSLKEMIDAPGARTRLLAALQPPPALWWKRPLPWAISATAAVGLLVVFVLVRAPHRQEFAKAPQLQTQASLDQPVQPPADSIAPQKERANQPALVRSNNSRQLPPPPPAVSAVPPPPQSAPEPETLKKAEASKLDTIAAAADNAVRDEKDAVPVPQQVAPPGSPAEVRRDQVAASTVGAAGAAPPQPAISGAVGGFAPASPRAAVMQLAGKAGQQPFAFDYTLQHESLTIRPLAAGFLQVTRTLTSGQQAILQPPARFEAGTSVTIAVPEGSASLTVDLMAQIPSRIATGALTSSEAVNAQRAKAVSKQKAGRVASTQPTSDGAHASITLAVP